MAKQPQNSDPANTSPEAKPTEGKGSDILHRHAVSQGETAAPAGVQARNAAAAKQQETARRMMATAPAADSIKSKADTMAAWPFWVGMGLTLAWFTIVFFTTMDAGTSGKIAGLPVTSIALGISGVVAPVAFLWMIVAYLQRASDVRAITEPLRRQLQLVLGTGSQAESRVRRFNEALERQLELMRQAGDGSYEVLQSAIQALQEEERAINNLAERSGKEIQRVAGIVRDNSEVLEDLLHDNRERFSDLSGRIAGHIAALDERADKAAERLGEMVDRLNMTIDAFKDAADHKLLACSEVAGSIGERERATEEAARRMNEMLMAARIGAQELSNVLAKNQDLLDQSGQRVMNRIAEVTRQMQDFTAVSDAREEKLAEKSAALSQTLAGEIATLETLTHRLEAQIVAANEGLGARSAELDAQQGRLAEQSGNLIQDLQKTVQTLDASAHHAFAKFIGLREGVTTQSTEIAKAFDLSGQTYEAMMTKLSALSHDVAENVVSISTHLAQQVESIAGNSARAVEAGKGAEQSVGEAVAQLERMIGRIFDAEARAKQGALGVTVLYDDVLQHVREGLANVGEIAETHVQSLDRVHQRFEKTGDQLKTRAVETEAAWKSLVDSAETQQGALQEQLRARMGEATELLNENAAAIEQARDDLYLHIEAGLARSQELMDTLSKLGGATREPFDAALARVKEAVAAGEQQLAQFAGSLSGNAEQVAQLSRVLAQHGENAGYRAAETLAGLDAVAARMEAIEHNSIKETNEVLLRLTSVATLVQSRMGELSNLAETEQRKIAEAARQLSLDINALVHDSLTADNRLSMASTALGEKAVQAKAVLQGEAKNVEMALQRLHGQFGDMAVQLRETTRMAYGEIDRTIARYGDLHALGQDDIRNKVEMLGGVVEKSSHLLQGLGGEIEARAVQLGNVQEQLKDSAHILDTTTQTALDRLSVFTHAMVATQTISGETAQQVFARLGAMHEQFNRQITAVSDGSLQMTASMRHAVNDLVEQSVGLAAASQQAEQRIANLAQATAMLQREAEQVRSAIDAEAASMQKRMQVILTQIDSATVGMERNALIAFDRTEGMAKRFEDMAQDAYHYLGNAAQHIEEAADTSAAKVRAVNKSLTEQLLNLTFAGEHLTDMDKELRLGTEKTAQHLTQVSREVGATALHAVNRLRLQVSGMEREAEGLLGRFDFIGQGLAHQSLGVMEITAGLEAQLRKLHETAAVVQEDAARARQRIIGETVEFKNEVSASTQNILVAGEALQQLGDLAITMVHQMVQRFVEATLGLREQFETQADRLQHVAEGAGAQLDSFSSKLEKNVSILDGLKETLGGSGQQVTETLEKANFLLRNMTGQVERMKAGTQEVSGVLLQRLSEMLVTFEDELKGMTNGAGISMDALRAKAQDISVELKREAEAVTAGVLESVHTMRGEVGSGFDAIAADAMQAIAQLRDQGSGMSQALRAATREALFETAERFDAIRNELEGEIANTAGTVAQAVESFKNQLAPLTMSLRDETTQLMADAARHARELQLGLRESFMHSADELKTTMETLKAQMDPLAASVHGEAALVLQDTIDQVQRMQGAFRTNLLGMAEALVGHLHQVQENGISIVEGIRGGAVAGAEEALRLLTSLRQSTETELVSMNGKIGGMLAELQRAGDQMKREMQNGGVEARDAALQQFAAMQQALEHEMNALLGHANGSVGQLQVYCERLRQDMSHTLQELDASGQRFGAISQAMQAETQKIGSVVQEAGQHLAGTQVSLQRSQATLFDVVNKSSEALNLFNENIAQQSMSMATMQGQILSADERLAQLQQNMRQMVSDISQQLQGALSNLGQQISHVKMDAAQAAEAMSGSGQLVAQQNTAIINTAQALAQALGQLEHVNQALTQSMKETSYEQQEFLQQYQGHAEKVRNVGQATGEWIGTLERQLQNQALSLERVADMAAQAADASAQKVSEVAKALQAPVEQVGILNERLDKTLGLSVLAGDKITGQLNLMQMNMDQALKNFSSGLEKTAQTATVIANMPANAALQAPTQWAASTSAPLSAPPSFAAPINTAQQTPATQPPMQENLTAQQTMMPQSLTPTSSEREMLQRIRDLARSSATVTPPNTPSATAADSFVMPQAAAPAAHAPSAFANSFAKATAPGAAAKPSSSSDLVQSLSQIIQQLEQAGEATRTETLEQKLKKLGT